MKELKKIEQERREIKFAEICWQWKFHNKVSQFKNYICKKSWDIYELQKMPYDPRLWLTAQGKNISIKEEKNQFNHGTINAKWNSPHWQ